MNWIKPDWQLPEGVHAATTLRTGGTSTSGYASLNPAMHVNDEPANVEANRRIIKGMLNLPSEPVWLQQVHGIDVIKADLMNAQESADASYTDQPGIVCAVLTADCLPLLFCGYNGRVIAAAHAGWRGLQAGIINQTLLHMDCDSVEVWLGPAISQDKFEVGQEVRNAFVSDNPSAASAFRYLKHDKWLADIFDLAKMNLAALGIKKIVGEKLCTACNPELFYSYRRDGMATGRMASLIWRDF
jgi:YfiH family protein